MITPNELDNIYDKGTGPGDETPPKMAPLRKSVGASTAKPVMDAIAKRDPSFDFGKGSQYNPDEFNNYLKEGLYEAKGNPYFMRGEAQSAWDKWGNMAAGIVPKIGTSLVETMGLLGSLATEWGDDRDYSNGMTQWAKETNETIDEVLPMYRKNSDTFGLTDAAWWTQNIQGLAVSATSFAGSGLGFAKAFGLLAKGAKAAKVGSLGVRATEKAGEYLTSGALAYTEGAMMGKSIYDETYDFQLKKQLRSGASLDKAHADASYIASQSAATTVQLNTMINTGLNLEMLSGFFKGANENRIRKFWEQEGKHSGTETFEDFAKRLRNETSLTNKDVAKQIFKTEGVGHLIKGGVFEGIEELTNQFAERTGVALGQEWNEKTKSGTTKKLFEQLGELSHYFERTMDKEGALSFALGAFGGMAQTSLVNNIPFHQVAALDSAGKVIPKQVADKFDSKGNVQYEMKRVSGRMRDKHYDRVFFSNVRDAIISDVGIIEDLKSKISVARAAGENDRADMLVKDLTNAMNYDAVSLGMAGNYIQTFKNIAETDNIKFEKENLVPQIEEMEAQANEMGDGPEKEALMQKIAAAKDKYAKALEVTEAMRKGLAKDANDNEYKKKAEAAVADLVELEKIHNKVMSKYGEQGNPAIQRVADIVSGRSMDLYMIKKSVKELEDSINDMQAEQDALIDASGDVTGFNREIINYNQNIQVAVETRERYDQQLKVLQQAGLALQNDPSNPQALAVINNMIKKYKILGISGVTDNTVVKELVDVLQRRYSEANEKIRESQDTLYNSTGYAKWVEKNPNGKFEDYTATVSKKHGISKKMLKRKAFLNEQKVELEEASARLLELTSEKGEKKMLANAEALYADLKKKTQKEREDKLVELKKRADQIWASEKALNRTNVRLREQYQQEMQELKFQHEKLTQDLIDVNNELAQTPRENGILFFKNQPAMYAWNELNARKNKIDESLVRVSRELIRVRTLYEKISNDIRQHEAEVNERNGILVKEKIVQENTVDDTLTSETTEPEVAEEVQQPEEPVIVDPAAVAAEDVNKALKMYLALIQGVPFSVQREIQKYEAEVKESGAPVSLSHLDQLAKDSKVEQEDLTRVMYALQKYAAAVKSMGTAVAQSNSQAIATTNSIGLSMPEPAGNISQNDDEGLVGEPGSFVILQTDSSEKDFNDLSIEERNASHAGQKAQSIIKINSLGLNYVTYWDPRTNKYRRYSLINELNENAHMHMLTPNKLKPGSKITLTVDTEFFGEVINTTQHEVDEYGDLKGEKDSSANYLDENGKVIEELLDNVPIKIVGEDGKTLGWLPRTKWLNMSYEGTSGSEKYANVQEFITMPDGTVINNLEIQQKLLKEARTAIVKAFNSGQTVETTIDSVGPGVTILNRNVNKNTESYKHDKDGKPNALEYRQTSNLLPDENLTIAVIQKGKVNVGQSTQFHGKMVLSDEKIASYNNLTVALLPGIDGSMHIAPLLSRKLFDENGVQSDFNTMVAAIEIFMAANSEDKAIAEVFEIQAAKIQQETATKNFAGFDVRTESGLKDFINQYFTWVKHFDDNVIGMSQPSKSTSKMEFLLKVEDRLEGQSHGMIKIGTTFSGKKPMKATLINGKLDPNFVKAMKQGLGNRRKNVAFTKENSRGINSKDTFVSPKYRINKNGSGTWEFTTHKNYNEYLKSVTKTNIVGTNQLPDGTYVYAVHPQVLLNVNKIIKQPEVEIEETSIVDPNVTTTEQKQKESILDKLDEFLSGSIQPSSPIVIQNTAGTNSKSGITVSVKSLTEKYNFTPLEYRNGKSVEEVLSELQRLGIAHMAPGYNPFSRCI